MSPRIALYHAQALRQALAQAHAPAFAQRRVAGLVARCTAQVITHAMGGHHANLHR